VSLLLSYMGAIAGCATVKNYAATVNGLAGGGPLAYWRLGNTSQINDAIGTRHGAYTGTVVPGAGLPSNSDGAVDFGGVGQGSIEHDSGLELSVFTLSLWFKLNAFPLPGVGSAPIISKEPSTGVNDGDTTIYVDDAGGLTIRVQQSSSFTISPVSALELDTSYHLALRADNTGFDAYINGQYLGKNTNVTAAWSANTAAIEFASSPPFAQDADVILDEVALFARALTEGEILELAQKEGVPPTAVADTFAAPESAATALDVTLNDSFAGSKAALTVEIVSQPGGGDSVAVNGNNDVVYTAGAVSENTARSFTYRITDGNGQSNIATVDVTVLDATAPTSNANCFVESGADTIVVSSMAALQATVNAAPPGRQILIAPGSYSGGTLTFDRDGTQANPIVIRPQNGLGTVTINGADWTFAVTSSRLVMSKLHLNNSIIRFAGTHNRITRCRLRNSRIRMADGPLLDCRIDHLDCSEDGTPIDLRGAGKFGTGAAARLLVDHCYFHDIPGTTTQIWDGFGDTAVPALGLAVPNGESVTFDTCLIENSGHNGEFVINKISGMNFLSCTFVNCNGEFELRSAFYGDIISCWFENIDGGIKPWGPQHKIHGNRFIGGMNLWCPIGNAEYQWMIDNGPQARYANCTDSTFIGNRLDTGHITVGNFWSGAANPPVEFPADNCLIEENTRDAGSPVVTFQNGNANNPLNPGWTNITVNPTTSISYTPAVKLTSSDVGLNAPDPFCPGGPQS
jgi:Concanavalin A-like lectin/glucanases superfamily/Bacterial Ig domain/Chondroitinase B